MEIPYLVMRAKQKSSTNGGLKLLLEVWFAVDLVVHCNVGAGSLRLVAHDALEAPAKKRVLL
jgi:hypothetical protein